MADTWSFHSDTFANCNCAANCGCQFNLPSTHGFCQFVQGGVIRAGEFNGVDLSGLHWASMMSWPGEIAEGNGTGQIVIDEKANQAQREALESIVSGTAGEPGSNHFSVFGSTCSKLHDTLFLPIECQVDIANRKASVKVPGVIDAKGEPLVDEFSGEPFHIALARPSGSFEFTYAEIGAGTAMVQGDLNISLDATYAHFCEHNYNQDGLIRAA